MSIVKKFIPLPIRSSILICFGSNLIQLTQLQSSHPTGLSEVKIRHLNGPPNSMLYLYREITRLSLLGDIPKGVLKAVL